MKSYKICSKCGKNKHIGKSYYKDTRKPGGIYSSCKDCYRERIGAKKRMPRERVSKTGEVMRRCSTCRKYKARRKFYSNPATFDGVHTHCKDCSIKSACSALSKESQKRRRQINRMIVLQVYSNGDVRCACCGEPTYEFLSIDHIDGGGNEHRRELGNGHMYRWLIRKGFPRGFQVLCHNCNLAKGFYGNCPHNAPDSTKPKEAHRHGQAVPCVRASKRR